MSPRKRGIVGGIVLALVLYGFAGGCTSATLPPALADAQRALIDTTRLPLTVGVEEYRFPVYSNQLIPALRATHLFSRVDSLARFSTPPTLVARVARRIYGTATIPFLTGISLGLVPTTDQEEWGHAFWLVSTGEPPDSLLVDFSYRGPTTLGWACLVLNLSPNRTSRNVRTHSRFSQGLAYAIAAQAPEIAMLGAASRLSPFQ